MTSTSVHQVESHGAVEIAPRVWWVGTVRSADTFQCHSYLIEAGEHSVLIDPGSVLTVPETLRRVSEVVPLSSVQWLVCHHSDPDIAGGLPLLREALPRPDLQVVTEWRAETLLRHYGANIPFFRVEEHGWELPLDAGRTLQFVLTPYLHFPGAMCSYLPDAEVLFSSDLFGGFTDGSQLFAADASYFEAMRPFHEHYMPSREILAAGLRRITNSFDHISLIAPQHGCIIPEHLVAAMFQQLASLECGIFLMARDDLDVARLLRVATVQRRMIDALVLAHDLPELGAVAERVLPDVLPVRSVVLYAESADEGLLRFSAADAFRGEPCGHTDHPATSVSIDIPGDGPAAHLVLGLSESVEITAELLGMFDRLAGPLRAALNRHLEQRTAEVRHRQLRETATRDALTGLHNRHALSALAPLDQQYGVLMLDIDHFKQVNDHFVHAAGDLVLSDVAAAIVSEVRAVDSAVRYGGEEMLVLVSGADRSMAASIAERIRSHVAALEFPTVPGQGAVTVSIGVAIHHIGQPIEESIADADASLYLAKGAGRDRVHAGWMPHPDAA